jgi:hypothetical protein
MGTFVLYEFSPPAGPRDGVLADETFGDQLELLAYQLPDDLAACARRLPTGARDGCSVLTYWRVLAPITEPRRFFLHALDPDGGELLAQHDGLDAPAQFWQAGDLLVQEHLLPAIGQEDFRLLLGVYNPENGRRLQLPGGSDSYTLRRP